MDKLTPEQQNAVLQQAQMEANQKIMQLLLEQMESSCFDKCAGTSGDKLDSREQSCFAYCQDLFLQTRAETTNALEKKQSSSFS